MRGFALAPRWLPATIGVLAGLLAVKSVTLVRTAATQGGVGELSLWSGDARAASAPEPKAAEPKTAEARAPAGKPADGAETKPAGTEAAPAEPPVSVAERTILLELRQRRQELEARAASLAERESLIVAAQEKLTARVDEMRDLQRSLEALDAERRKQEDTSWQGLVKLYETMKPREAAAIFNDLAMPVLVQVMDRMKDAKAASVLAAMDPDKARTVTQALAKLRTRIEIEPRPVAAPAATPAAAGARANPTQPQPQARPRAPSG